MPIWTPVPQAGRQEREAFHPHPDSPPEYETLRQLRLGCLASKSFLELWNAISKKRLRKSSHKSSNLQAILESRGPSMAFQTCLYNPMYKYVNIIYRLNHSDSFLKMRFSIGRSSPGPKKPSLVACWGMTCWCQEPKVPTPSVTKQVGSETKQCFCKLLHQSTT